MARSNRSSEVGSRCPSIRVVVVETGCSRMVVTACDLLKFRRCGSAGKEGTARGAEGRCVQPEEQKVEDQTMATPPVVFAGRMRMSINRRSLKFVMLTPTIHKRGV